MAHTQTWDSTFEASPADADDAKEGAGKIRDLKRDVRERLDLDHIMDDDDNDDGLHRQITFKAPLGSDPTTATNKGFLYTKDVSSVVELFWKDESGNVVQLTTGGALDLQKLGSALDTNAFAINESEAAAVASAATTDIWATTGNTLHVTGTVTITSLGTAPRVGAWRKVIFDGAPTLTHGTNLNLPGSANIATAAGDIAFVYADTTTQFDVLYFKADGKAVVSSGLPAPDFTSSEQTVTDDTVLNVAHSLGALPSLWSIVLLCKTTEHGYSVGDEVMLFVSDNNADRNATFSVDATNMTVIQGSAITVHSQSTLNAASVTNGNWRWKMRAWK